MLQLKTDNFELRAHHCRDSTNNSTFFGGSSLNTTLEASRSGGVATGSCGLGRCDVEPKSPLRYICELVNITAKLKSVTYLPRSAVSACTIAVPWRNILNTHTFQPIHYCAQCSDSLMSRGKQSKDKNDRPSHCGSCGNLGPTGDWGSGSQPCIYMVRRKEMTLTHRHFF